MKKTNLQVSKQQECLPLILIIDDSKFMHAYMKNLLEGFGYRVKFASNGLEGIQLFEESKPAVVLIDAIMPVMDGFMTCSTIRNMEGGKDALLLMITTETDATCIDKAFRVGFDDYFVKPILDGVFINRMKKLFQDKCLAKLLRNNANPGQIFTELNEARCLQLSLLPKPFANQYISVNKIYSPYDQVSGDLLDYWWSDKEKALYGYIVDATGHSVASAMQVCSLRVLFCQLRLSGLSLSSILGYINFEILKNQYRYIATAIMFSINFKERKIYYAAAGISPFFIFKGKDTTPQPILTSGYPLGYKKEADYEMNYLSFGDVREIIFASDGFSDMFNSRAEITSKHDDASAILIKLQK